MMTEHRSSSKLWCIYRVWDQGVRPLVRPAYQATHLHTGPNMVAACEPDLQVGHAIQQYEL